MKCLICKKKLGRRTIEVTVKSFNTKRKIYNTILHPICFDCIVRSLPQVSILPVVANKVSLNCFRVIVARATLGNA